MIGRTKNIKTEEHGRHSGKGVHFCRQDPCTGAQMVRRDGQKLSQAMEAPGCRESRTFLRRQ